MVGRSRTALPPFGAPPAIRAVWVVALVSTVLLATLLVSLPSNSSTPITPPGLVASGTVGTPLAPVPDALARTSSLEPPAVAPSTLAPSSSGSAAPPRLLTPSATVLPPPGQVVTNVGVGSAPQGAVFDPTNGWVYVTNTGSDTVTVLNGTKTVGAVSVGSYPSSAAVNTTTGFVYVTNYYGDSVSIINGTTVTAMVRVSTSNTAGPYAIAYDPMNGWMYVAEYGLGAVAVISGTNVTATIPVSAAPAAVLYDPANLEVYVACNGASTVSYISGTRVLGSARVGTQPTGLAFDVQNGYLYVVNNGGNTVSLLDATNRVVTTIGVGNGPVEAQYDPLNSYVYVSDYLGDNLTVLNGTSIAAMIGTGLQPFGLAYDDANGCLYVSQFGSNSVLVLSTRIVEGSVASTPPGSPLHTADVGESVTFNVTVWFLGSGTPLYTGSLLPASGLGCPTQPTFTYSGGAGNLAWACHALNASQYSVTFNVTDPAGVTVTATLAFQVYTDPNASAPDVNIGAKSGLTEADIGQVVNFSEDPTGGTGIYSTYLWETFPINMCGNTSSANPVCVFTREYTVPLDLKVLVTDSNGASSVSPSIKLQVNVMPAAGTPTVNRTSADVGQTLNFSTTVSGGSGAISYAWAGLPTGCLGAGTATPSCVPKLADTYSVSVTVTDSVGGTSPRTPAVTATVFSDPKVTSISATPSSVTVGNPVLITAKVTGGWGNYTFNWSGLPPGCSGHSVTINCRPSAVGSYPLVLSVTDENGFSTKSTPTTVKVIAQTTPGSGDTNTTPVLIFGLPQVVFYAIFGSLTVIVLGVGVAIIVRSRRAHRLPPESGPPPPPSAATEEPPEEFPEAPPEQPPGEF